MCYRGLHALTSPGQGEVQSASAWCRIGPVEKQQREEEPVGGLSSLIARYMVSFPMGLKGFPSTSEPNLKILNC